MFCRETHNGANYENSGMDYCNEKLHNPGEKETGNDFLADHLFTPYLFDEP